MARLHVFNSVSLDGFFKAENDDISWTKEGADDAEWQEFVASNASNGGPIVLGRKTYEMMASFWTTKHARDMMPVVAEGMNNLPKIVFSTTLDHAGWSNSRLVKSDAVAAMRQIKKDSEDDLVILGSGTLVSQFTEAGLIDAYQLVVVPVILGNGCNMFEGVREQVKLELEKSRAFKNGRIVLTYGR